MTSHATSPRLSRSCRHHAARRASSAGCRNAQRGARSSHALVGERLLSLVVTDAPSQAPLAIEFDDAGVELQIEAIAETAFFRELAGKAAEMRSSFRGADVRKPLRRAA